MKDTQNTYLTVHQSPTPMEMVKFSELMEVEESIPLKLVDRKAINTLILHSWEKISEPDQEHRISKRKLRGAHDTSTNPARLEDILSRLQACQLKVMVQRDGKPYKKSISLLRSFALPQDGSGDVIYQFEEDMVDLFQSSTHWGRLELDVMLHFRSKYALALYELVQKRINLKWKWSEKFEVAQLRKLLGVPDKKLLAYKTFKQKALVPAFVEVNGLSNVDVQFLEHKTGRRVSHIEVSWRGKDIDGLKESYAERQRGNAGRHARLTGTVESILPYERVLEE